MLTALLRKVINLSGATLGVAICCLALIVTALVVFHTAGFWAVVAVVVFIILCVASKINQSR